MITRTKASRVCELCGETINYTICSEDGRDWYGHQRGSSESYEEDNDHECDHIRYKRMCVNCEYNEDGRCVNEQVIKAMSDSLKFPFKVSIVISKIEDVTHCCDHWSLRDTFAKALFVAPSDTLSSNYTLGVSIQKFLTICIDILE